MKDWQTNELGPLVKQGDGRIQTGPFGSQLHAADYVESGIPCIMPANMKNNRVDLTGIAQISEADAQRLKHHLVKEGDIVYSRRGDVTQKALISKAEEGYFCGTGCLLLRPGNKISSKFLTYYLTTEAYQSWILSQAVGATMPNLNTGILKRISFNAPPKEQQESIAHVLSLLDEKIELNNRINAELEGLAKLLYDYWFVQFDFPMTAEQAAAHGDPTLTGKPYKSSGGKMTQNKTLNHEIPEGWEGGSILDVATLGGGGTPNKKEPSFWDHGHIPFFTPTDTTKEIFCLKTASQITQEGADKSATTIYPPGTIFITARGSVGSVVITDSEMAMSQSCYALKPNAEIPSPFLLFHVHAIMGYLKAKSSGSVFKSIVTNDLKFTPSVVPPTDCIKKFGELTNPMFSQILNHQKQNQELAALRDWLLPMLMNGQVTVQSEG